MRSCLLVLCLARTGNHETELQLSEIGSLAFLEEEEVIALERLRSCLGWCALAQWDGHIVCLLRVMGAQHQGRWHGQIARECGCEGCAWLEMQWLA